MNVPAGTAPGQTIQVQLVCQPPVAGGALPLTPKTPGDGKPLIYSYINPAHPPPSMSIPPPNMNPWTTAVDDFLTRLWILEYHYNSFFGFKFESIKILTMIPEIMHVMC